LRVPTLTPTKSATADRFATNARVIARTLASVPEASTGGGAIVPRISRQEVTARIQGLTLIARRIDRLEAVLSTWDAVYTARAGNTMLPPTFAAPTTPVWVVAVAGDTVPQFSHGKHYPWAVFVSNADTGQPMATFAGTGAWPAFFTTLRDLAP